MFISKYFQNYKWKYDKIWNKISSTYTIYKRKRKNHYILIFCENNGSPKLAKKPNFLLYNAKPKNNLSGIVDIN